MNPARNGGVFFSLIVPVRMPALCCGMKESEELWRKAEMLK